MGLSARWIRDYDWVYSDQGTGAPEDLTIYRPRPHPGWFALGDYAQSNHRPGYASVPLVRDSPDGSALAPPISYQAVWNDRGSGGLYDCAIWRPVAPPGYLALGDVAGGDYAEPPPLDLIRCVRSDLVVQGGFADAIYRNVSSLGSRRGAASSMQLWPVVATDHRGVSAGCFRVTSGGAPPLSLSSLPVVELFGAEPASYSDKVLIIGIDGCRPDCLNQLRLQSRVPSLSSLISGGAYWDDAATGYPMLSGPGWSSLFTSVWLAQHGVVGNDFTKQVSQFQNYPHFFSRLKELRPGLMQGALGDLDFIASQLTMNAEISSLCTTEEVAPRAQQLLQSTAALDILYLHFDNVDEAGHQFGYGSPEYLAAIVTADGYVAQVLAGLKARPTYESEKWLILVTTDHGGHDHTHGYDPIDQIIFIIADGVQASPRTERRTIVDLAPTIAAHLGIAVDPSWGWLGQPI